MKKALHDKPSVPTGYCPHCGVVTSLSVSIVPSIVTELDGSARIVASRMYHCESCRSFVRSEEDEAQADLLGGEVNAERS